MAKKKKCKSCGKMFTQSYSTLQIACSTKCAINYAKTKKKEQAESLNDARIEKAVKDTLSALKTSLMIVCHKFIRERDKFLNCISCGAKWHKDFQAGHFFKAELYSNLKFNEFNINGQCQKCNLRKDGNPDGYRKGFIERYGVEKLKELDQLALDYKQEDFKWDRSKLVEQRKYYNIKLKQL